MPPVRLTKKVKKAPKAANASISEIAANCTEENRMYDFTHSLGLMSIYHCKDLALYVVTLSSEHPAAADIQAIYSEEFYREMCKEADKMTSIERAILKQGEKD